MIYNSIPYSTCTIFLRANITPAARYQGMEAELYHRVSRTQQFFRVSTTEKMRVWSTNLVGGLEHALFSLTFGIVIPID